MRVRGNVGKRSPVVSAKGRLTRHLSAGKDYAVQYAQRYV